MTAFEQFLYNLGYLGVFIGTYLSATVLPLSVAPLTLSLPALGFSPWLVGATAVAGASFGALTMYIIAFHGGEWLLTRFNIEPDPVKLARSQQWFAKWGAPALFFSFLPFIGDTLVVTAGLLRVRWSLFAVWLVAGRAVQYGVMLSVADTAVVWLNSF